MPKVEPKIEVPRTNTSVRPSDAKHKLQSLVVKPDHTLKSSRKTDAPALPTNNSKPAARQSPTESGKASKTKKVSQPTGSRTQPSTSIAPPSAELATRPPSTHPTAIVTDGSLRCPFCERQLPNRKALRVHLIQVQKLQEQRRERQSSPTPELNRAPTPPTANSENTDPVTDDASPPTSPAVPATRPIMVVDPSGRIIPQSDDSQRSEVSASNSPTNDSQDTNDSFPVSDVCPNDNCRKGTDLHILFPINEKLVCTEEGCSTPFKTNDWHSTKNSLARHLRTKHRILIKRSVYWCFICQTRIYRHPAEHACLQGCIVASEQSSNVFRCDICSFDSPTQLGLNNHKKMHRRKDAEESMPKRNFPRPKKRRRKNKRRGRQQSPEANPSGDEGAIDDPSISLAAPVIPNTLPPTPPAEREDRSLLAHILSELNSLSVDDPSEDNFLSFCILVEQAVQEAQRHLFERDDEARPAHPRERVNRPDPDPKDPAFIQRLYTRNPKSCTNDKKETTALAAI
ncbi:hypothetical protein AVEN_102102-1 [Araneus ventricosus]|uniref:C2H2-type domain-containing protein n=1 Tax=Araneus ventricosus TaxID=182803 RepID=A0A4Y2V244_ARAVE|nr:hypothetical protein AVEN_102102-1 [Araneus ventricosus]